MKKVINTSFLLLTFLLSASAFSQTGASGLGQNATDYCTISNLRKDGLQKSYDTLFSDLFSKMESIPPGTYEYLENEFNEALYQYNEGRLQIISQNQFYKAFLVEKELRELDLLMKLKYSPSPITDAKSNEVLYYLRIDRKLASVVATFGEYLEYYLNRVVPIFDRKHSVAVLSSKIIFSNDIDYLIKCAIQE